MQNKTSKSSVSVTDFYPIWDRAEKYAKRCNIPALLIITYFHMAQYYLIFVAL